MARRFSAGMTLRSSPSLETSRSGPIAAIRVPRTRMSARASSVSSSSIVRTRAFRIRIDMAASNSLMMGG